MKKILYIFFLLFTLCGKSKMKSALQEADRYYKKRSYLKALLSLNDYRERKDPAIQFMLGKIYLGLKNLGEAQSKFKRAIEMDSTYIDSVVRVCVSRSKELYNVGEEDLVIQIFKFLTDISSDEKIGEGFRIPGFIYYNNGEYPAAERMFVKALRFCKDKSKRKEIWEKLIRLKIEMRDWKGAFLYGDRAIGEGFVELKNFLGQAAYTYSKELYKEGYKDSAFVIVQKVIELKSPSMLMPDAYLFYGDLLLDRGDYEGALNAYREVLKLVIKDDEPVAIEARARIELIKGMKK